MKKKMATNGDAKKAFGEGTEARPVESNVEEASDRASDRDRPAGPEPQVESAEVPEMARGEGTLSLEPTPDRNAVEGPCAAIAEVASGNSFSDVPPESTSEAVAARLYERVQAESAERLLSVSARYEQRIESLEGELAAVRKRLSA